MRLLSPFLVLSLLGLAACEKKTTEIAQPKEVASPTASAAKPAETTATPAASDAAAPAAVASASAAPDKPKEAPKVDTKPSTTASAAVALKPAAKHVAGKNYALDLATPGCKADTECAVTIKLATAGDWHVNKEYPYKFIATAAPNMTFLGKGDATTFSRGNGDFAEQGEKVGVMTVRFKPASAGEAHVAGTYKFSVCSADQCQIEQEKLDLAVPVM
jgi:hypothetical protein